MSLAIRAREWWWGIRKNPDPDAPRLLMFDFDGVIADSLEIYLETFLEACGEIGARHIQSREAFLSLMDGNFAVQLMRQGFPLRKLRALAAHYEPRIREVFARVRPFPTMPGIVNHLADKHSVYIITSNRSDFVLEFLERFGLKGIRGVIGSDAHTSKIRKILQVRRAEQGRVPWYIGDTLGDMLEGKRAGARVAAVTWGWHDEARLRRGDPDHVFRDPGELTGFPW
ncbi:MAG TPA: HAD hydrolase-like protein [Candidatus Hydrogenedentes bacterium]|nr:HAD family hydrolase [Candidatus Hydrogenedentota bacterium]HOJ69738.1 HAD hydrolase-like protein [Candidatus Hydrogenedentota bacterium]HOK89996.1 HAD hydrolase-like protein [Candidatus Hydrogenedentota bacterium]HOV60890.1 HAD hydrolase-like protein [Candidatus Hydrogenedentota bacterium]HPO29706.1 HAD hydrolase-like protein [Candidatus Hydrogenedentota bacterium]